MHRSLIPWLSLRRGLLALAVIALAVLIPVVSGPTVLARGCGLPPDREGFWVASGSVATPCPTGQICADWIEGATTTTCCIDELALGSSDFTACNLLLGTTTEDRADWEDLIC